MAANKEPIFPVIAKAAGTTFNNASGTTASAIFTAATTASGSIITGVIGTSTATSANVANILYNDGSSDFMIGSTSIAASAGFDGSTASKSVFNLSDIPALQSDGSLQVQTGHSIKLQFTSAIAAGKQVDILVNSGDYEV